MSRNFNVEKDWTTGAGLRAVVILCLNDDGTRRHRCGYVGVPSSFQLYGKHYDQQVECISQEDAESATVGEKSPILALTAMCRSDDEYNKVRRSLDIVVDCHGGLTFSGGHGKYPIESDLWWFGFDCSHYGDACIDPSPYGFVDHSATVKSLEFCEAQCESIAAQLTRLEQKAKE